ncbi:MAG TPA: permease-like cell division protein FtsX [Candidatus Acidoferrales bacterium]|nr:permease-like cell division protein FtsX [Candidatus Acidoferrales bacterium]
MAIFFLREAWRSINAHRGLAFTAVFSMTAALTLCATFLLVSFNVQRALLAIGDRREMVVYLKDEASDADVKLLQDKITQYYGSSTFVSRAQAWSEFSQQVGDPELLQAVETNPLPASLRVKLRPELQNFAAMDTCAHEIERFPQVEAVRFGAEWVRRLDELNDDARRTALAAGAVVALAIVLVLYNTLRLTVVARRQQVEIMNRLGAGDRFIAIPFVIEALLEVLIAATISLGLAGAMSYAASQRLPSVSFLPPAWSLAFVGGAVVLGWLASTLALTRILRTVGP